MYTSFLRSELKKWTRDSMMGFMLVYPIIFALLGRYFLPWLGKKYGFDFTLYVDLILTILVLFIPISYGALIGFSILDDRDGNILTNIRVTPLSVHKFLSFRLMGIYFLSVLSTILVIWFSDIADISPKNIIFLALLASLEAPISGLLINSLAKNKVEGFAIMKLGSSIILFPVIALFINNVRELFFAFAPGFWTAKSISSIVKGGNLYLSFNQYYFLGLIYMIVLNIIVYKLFMARVLYSD